jgi:hypothetical protein
MRNGRLRATYLGVRRWLDGELSQGANRGMGGLPFVAALSLAAVVHVYAAGPIRPAGVGAFLLMAVAWVAFMVWRGVRLMRVASIKSARDYDRRGKFDLPPEYAASESHLAHQERHGRRHRRRRAR